MNSREMAFGSGSETREPRHLFLHLIRTFNRVTIGLLAAGLLIFCGYNLVLWVINGPLFGLRCVVVEGNKRLTQGELAGIMSVRPGCPLFHIKPEEMAGKLEEHCLVRKAHVRLRWPGTLLVAIDERQPVAVFAGNIGAVADDAVFVPFNQTPPCPDLPVLVGVDPGSAGYGDMLAQKEIAWALSLLQGMACLKPDMPYSVKQIDVRDFGHPLIFVRQCDVPIMIGNAGSISQLESLPYVLADVRQKDIRPEYIDLRFANQIIVKMKAETETETDMGLESQAVKG